MEKKTEQSEKYFQGIFPQQKSYLNKSYFEALKKRADGECRNLWRWLEQKPVWE